MNNDKYYKILGLEPGATEKKIISAYRKAALKYHPDKNRGSEKWAKEEFQKVHEAYTALTAGSSKAPRREFKFTPGADHFKEFAEFLREVERNLDKIEKDLNDIGEDLKGHQERLWNEVIRNMEENLSLAGISASDLDSSLWSPYGDWKEKVRNSVDSGLEVFLSNMRIAIDKAKRKKINANNANHKSDYNNNYSWNSQPPPNGKYDNENYSNKNFSPNDKGGWSGEGKPTPNYTPEYIKAIEEKIEFYKERLLKTSDEREKQKYREMASNLEKELATLRNQSNNQDQNTQDQPPKTPKPSPEQEKSAKDKLEEATNSNNKEDIKNALNETNETVKNSSDSDLKKKKEQAEDKLGEVDPEELRKIIKEEVAKELQKFGIKAADLSSESKQKLDKFNNNINPAETKKIRTEVLNEAGVKALEKLITELSQAIESKKGSKEIENKTKALQQFIEDNSDEYAQNAYSLKKDKVQELLAKAEANISKNVNKSNDKFPTGLVVGGGILLLVGLATILIIRKRRKKKMSR